MCIEQTFCMYSMSNHWVKVFFIILGLCSYLVFWLRKTSTTLSKGYISCMSIVKMHKSSKFSLSFLISTRLWIFFVLIMCNFLLAILWKWCTATVAKGLDDKQVGTWSILAELIHRFCWSRPSWSELVELNCFAELNKKVWFRQTQFLN